MGLRGYFIQYKFIVPETTKHSSYTYQKLFRALYGYTQNVCKSTGKTYKYHRRGVLSSVAYLRPGKNCVIIPPSAFTPLTTFFKTGQNPTHYWRGRGDWKAVYYMDEKTLGAAETTKALERLIDRLYVLTTSKAHEKLDNELANVVMQLKKGSKPEQAYSKLLVSEAEAVIANPWFKDSVSHSQKLNQFYNDYVALKGA